VQVASVVEMFDAQIVDVGLDAVSVEATGEQDKVDALQRVLEPFGIKEIVQSGMIAIGRGPKSMTDRSGR
jgi:acetolactate synthase-1/3 small subunit